MAKARAQTAEAAVPAVLRRYRPHLSAELRRSLDGRANPVYHLLRYYMGWVDVEGRPAHGTEGKALRPSLCLYACEAVGGTVHQATPVAVALELIHNFSLIHDDIQDQDETRHHRPTLWKVWGVPKAIVAGNVMRVVADMAVAQLLDRGVPPARALKATELLTATYLEMIEGQYLDLSYEGRPDIGLDQYLDMISRKTGALIRSSLTLGAIIGTDRRETVEAFQECGRALGYVFQIRDDILGVWGDEGTTGKPVGADIRRKKNSFPVVYTLSTVTGADRQYLLEAYSRPELDDEQVAGVLAVMERAGARERAQEMAAHHCRRALEALSGATLGDAHRRDMEELAHFLLVREA